MIIHNSPHFLTIFGSPPIHLKELVYALEFLQEGEIIQATRNGKDILLAVTDGKIQQVSYDNGKLYGLNTYLIASKENLKYQYTIIGIWEGEILQ